MILNVRGIERYYQIECAENSCLTDQFLTENNFQIISDAQRSSVWRSVAKASAERPDFAERERALERLTPER